MNRLKEEKIIQLDLMVKNEIVNTNLFSIPFDLPFLKTLSRFVIEKYYPNPQQLNHLRIILPNQRGCLNFYHAFIDMHQQICPHVTLPHPKLIPIRNANKLLSHNKEETYSLIPHWKQHALSMKLVQHYFSQRRKTPSFTELVDFTDSLIGFLHEWALSEKNINQVESILESPLSEHHLFYLDFVKHLIEEWPKIMTSLGYRDPPSLMVTSIEALTEEWKRSPPPYPVMIAGTTGTVPATTRLIQTILEFPNGFAVLPGYSEEVPSNLIEETHPQHGAHVLKRKIEKPVEILKVEYPISEYISVECDDIDHEAWTLSLIIREHHHLKKRICLVTQNKHLELKLLRCLEYWNIKTNTSAGEPFSQSKWGQFIILSANLFHRPNLEDILSVLKHPVFQKAHQNLDTILTFERELRLKETLAYYKTPWEIIDLLPDEMKASLKVFRISYSNVVSKAVEHVKWLETYLEGEKYCEWFMENALSISQSHQYLPNLSHVDYKSFIAWVLTKSPAIHRASGIKSTVDILPPVEARLNYADIMILGDLNEDSWPEASSKDNWLGEIIRKSCGLHSQTKKIGFSAYDFEICLSAPTVIFSRSRHQNGILTRPSRFLMKVLKEKKVTLHKEWPGKGHIIFKKHQINTQPLPCSACPPIEARPRKLSSTSLELLMRDPYGFYAKYILKLRPLLSYELSPDNRLKGILIHEIIHEILKSKTNFEIEKIINAYLQKLSHHPEIHFYWKPLIDRSLKWLQEWLIDKKIIGSEHYIQRIYKDTTFHARVDALIRLNETNVIVDFKTGIVPTLKDCLLGYSPQLPVEAFIHQSNVDLAFIYLSGADSRKIDVMPSHSYLEAAERGLERLIKTFYEDGAPYLSLPIMAKAPRFNDYQHLERVSYICR